MKIFAILSLSFFVAQTQNTQVSQDRQELYESCLDCTGPNKQGGIFIHGNSIAACYYSEGRLCPNENDMFISGGQCFNTQNGCGDFYQSIPDAQVDDQVNLCEDCAPGKCFAFAQWHGNQMCFQCNPSSTLKLITDEDISGQKLPKYFKCVGN